jgi:RNA polymerase sigma factor (sigma-70 family)
VARVRRAERLGAEAVRSATEIFNEYSGFIQAVIRFRAHNRSEEENLFQEFFLTLVRKPVPPDVRNIKSYLYRAIVSQVVDSMRRQESYERAVKKYVREARFPINNRPAENVFIEDAEERRNAVIAYFVRHLQEREAQAFVLRYRDNFSIGEIAVKMGVNVRTVSRYLSEGLRRLRKTLATR